jgi:hypothetical protein
MTIRFFVTRSEEMKMGKFGSLAWAPRGRRTFVRPRDSRRVETISRIASVELSAGYELGSHWVPTIHELSLDTIVSIILGDEELEVGLWVFDASDLIFVVDEISGSCEQHGQ